MPPACSVDECLSFEGGAVGKDDGVVREGGYVCNVDVDEALVKEGEEVGGVVKYTYRGASPDDAAVGNQLFGLGMVVVFCSCDGIAVYYAEEAAEKSASNSGVVQEATDRRVGVKIDAGAEKCHKASCSEFLEL